MCIKKLNKHLKDMVGKQIDKKAGFLLPIIHYSLFFLCRCCSFWSWSIFYKPKNGTEVNGKIQVEKNNIGHDTGFLMQTVLGIVLFYYLPRITSIYLEAFVFAFSIWNVLDLLLHTINVLLFGWMNDPLKTEIVSPPQSQRRFILFCLHYISLLFYYALIYKILGREPNVALKMSFAILTTIGDVNFTNCLTATLGFVQFSSGLLIIAGVIAQMVSVLKTTEDDEKKELKAEGRERYFFCWEWRFQKWLPPTITTVFILLIGAVFYVSKSSTSELKAEKLESSNIVTGVSDPNYISIGPPVDSNIVKTNNKQLRGDIYKEAVECFRREMDNYKWIIQYALDALGVIIAIAAIVVAIVIYRLSKKVEKTEKQVEVNDLWNEAGTAYNIGHYEGATEIWSHIYEKFKPNTRQFFNNWGSSLLNWAGTIEKGDKQKQLTNEAINKYLKAEEFTRGIAAYNIACCHAILEDEEKCKEWLETSKQTGRLLSWERSSSDRDLQKYAEKGWFKKIWGK